MNRLDQEEQETLNAFESGKTKRSKSSKHIRTQHQSYAEAMVKDSRINIRLSSKELREAGGQ